jgi:ankyrin repeat protein
MEAQIIDLYRIGKLEDAKQLLNQNPVKRDNSFCDMCFYGNLELAKMLLKIEPNIDISKWNDQPFRFACVKGHLEIAKWLYEIKPDINISSKNEYAFRFACYNGYFEVAQWLFIKKTDINISAENEFAFRNACIEGRLEVAEWLQSLFPEKYSFKVVENGKIYYNVKTKK